MSLMAQSRHPDRVGECPFSGVKRTSLLVLVQYKRHELQPSPSEDYASMMQSRKHCLAL